MKKKLKIGVLGGSFDPAHKGHLAISKEAKKRFNLKKIIWAITSDQFNEIMEFVNNVPSLTHDIEFTCTSCNKDNTYTLRGINDFFS